MKGWLSALFGSDNGLSDEKSKEIKEAKASQLSVLRQFAEESGKPDLIAHVRRREHALKRADDVGVDVLGKRER